jgi:hypothetical protein
MRFRRNILSPSSGSKPSNKPISKAEIDVKEIVVKDNDMVGYFI